MNKIIIIIIVSLLFISCKSKKSYVETHSTDTIYKSEVIKITPSQLNSIKIENICDSLGTLKPFTYTFTSGKAKGSLKAIKNGLELTYNIDSIVDVKVNEYKSTIKTEKEVIIKEVKNKLNLYSILLNVIFGLWIFKSPLLKLIKVL